MAIKRIAADGSGGVALELSRDEYRVITRALVHALNHALEVGASADEADIKRMLLDLRHELVEITAR